MKIDRIVLSCLMTVVAAGCTTEAPEEFADSTATEDSALSVSGDETSAEQPNVSVQSAAPDVQELDGVVTCGDAVCPKGEVCCNDSCGICTPPGGSCIQIECQAEPECKQNSHCTLSSETCLGCNCVALGPEEPLPICEGNGVQCLVNPCLGRKAICQQGQCVVE